MPNEELVAYIREEEGRGISKEEIAKSALGNGWPTESINQAFAAVESGTSVPPASSPSVQSASFPYVKVVLGVLGVGILLGGIGFAIYEFWPQNALAQALAQAAKYSSISEHVVITFHQATSTEDYSGNVEVNFDSETSQGTILATTTQAEITATNEFDLIIASDQVYGRFKMDSNNEIFNQLFHGGQYSSWIQAPIGKFASSSQFAALFNTRSLADVLKVPSNKFQIIAQTATTESTDYLVVPKPEYLNTLSSKDQDFFKNESMSGIHIIVHNDTKSIEKLEVDSANFKMEVTIAENLSPQEIVPPQRYITFTAVENELRGVGASIPGFTFGTSTADIGSNRTFTGTSTVPVQYHHLELIPFGDVPSAQISTVQKVLTSTFTGVDVIIGSTASLSLDLLLTATSSGIAGTQQYDSWKLLTALTKLGNANSDTIYIGIIAADIAHPGVNFIFNSEGPAEIVYDTPPVAIFSTFRVTSTGAALTESLYKKLILRMVAITVKVSPSANPACIMAQSLSLLALAQKGTAWCSDDIARLTKAGLIDSSTLSSTSANTPPPTVPSPYVPSGVSVGTVTGYVYQTKSGPNFNSITLPAWQITDPNFQNYTYDVSILTGTDFVLFKKAHALEKVTFPPGGVTAFKVTGLDPAWGICSSDRNVTWAVSFVESGEANFTRQAITSGVPNTVCSAKDAAALKK